MERVNDLFLLVGRFLLASLFLTVGIPAALQGYGGPFAQYLARLGVPNPEIMAVVAVAIEVLVPIALILGVFPRLSALLLIAYVLVATGLAHRFWELAEPAARQNQLNHFLKNIAVIGGLLFYYVAGAGAWALGGRGEHAGAGAHARA